MISVSDLPATSTAVIFTIIAAVALHTLLMIFSRKNKLNGCHVLITGGSKGLGLALAREFIRRGCDISILARNNTELLTALENLESFSSTLGTSPKIQAIAADVTSSDDLAKAFATAEASNGPVEVVVCNAGLSIPGLFIDQDVRDFQRQMEVNYFGAVRTIKCALPGMLARRHGHVVITTSMLSVLGFAGYSSYAPSKWALRGLADCLHNELQGTGVRLSVGYPPDTDTPGYALEEAYKPGLCKAVNAALGSELFTADKVAKRMVRQIERGAYHLTPPDIGAGMLASTMSSLSPKSLPAVVGILLAPVLQVVTSLFGKIADRAAAKYNKQHGYPPTAAHAAAEPAAVR